MRSSFGIVASLVVALGLTASASADLTVQNFWHLGESGGNLPVDSVGGKNFTGQVGNQVADTSSFAPGSTASLKYDGYGGTYMANASDFITVPADNWVIELWVNFSRNDQWTNIISLGQDDGHAKIGMSPSGDIFFGRENKNFGPLYSGMTTNAWHELAYVQTGGKVYGYVDGNLAGDFDGSDASYNNNGAVHIGVKPGNSEWMNGGIDEVRFSTINGTFDKTDLLYFHQPVPEPASLTALGLGAAAMLRRRRAAKK